MLNRSLALFGLTLVLGACGGQAPVNDSPTPPERHGEPVQTDALVYVLTETAFDYSATAVATYTNATTKNVYFNRCEVGSESPVYGITRAPPDEEKPSAVTANWGCPGGIPRGVVKPGGTLVAQVNLGSSISPEAQPPIQPENRVGRFQIRFDLYSEPGNNDEYGNELPDTARISNVFDIRFGE